MAGTVDTIVLNVTDNPDRAVDGSAPTAPPVSVAADGAGIATPRPATTLSGRGWLIGAALVGAFSVASLTLALFSQQRVKALEQELVRRQQDSQGQVVEARALAKQAQDASHATEAKVALLDARVAETALQRTQLEDLIQQLSRSRDENVLADVDAAVRVAVQQSAITGSAEPLVGALRQAEERLSRINQPRVERVRRALARDLDRVRAVALTDIASLTIKLDEAIRSVDELPLLSQPDRRAASAPAPRPAASARVPARTGSAPAAVATPGWWPVAEDQLRAALERIWVEIRGLVRVTQIANPEAMLVAPEQAWFLRENLKLRLLNARLALLSRQFDTAQSDLRDALGALDRYFDRSSRRVGVASELVRQVAAQARLVTVPRPDETLAAIAAAQAGR
jgi:uroporphyrin-III C-methyltransferase